MLAAFRNRPLSAVYDSVAAGWHVGVQKLGYPAAYRDLIAAHPFGARHVVDVGVGSGHFALAWIERAGVPDKLTILDPSRAMLTDAAHRLAEHRVEVEPVEAGIGCADVKPGSADVVLCAHVIEHLDDPKGALCWLHDRLRPGGRLYLAASQPHWCTALIRMKYGHRAFQAAEVRTMLRDAGFVGISELAFRAGPPSRTSRGYVAERPAR